jgi:RNA polymerase sigma factor (sigma-70 family)
MANVTLEPVLDYIDKLARQRTNQDATDADLLSRFVTLHDEHAFLGLLERYARLVWQVCRRVHSNVHDAEDSFQATFFVLARKAAQIRCSQSLASWLYRLAYRTAMHANKNAYRRRLREKKVAVPAGQAIGGISGLHELQAVLDEEVNRLAEKHRAPFVLCCLEGKSKSEAAAELGWKLGTVSSRLAQARKLLQDRLTRRGITLAAVLTAGAVSGPTTLAAMPATLLTATAQAALQFALGQPTRIAGCASATSLAKEVLKAMGWQKLKVVGAILLATAILGTGTTVASYGAISLNPPTVKPETTPSPEHEKSGLTLEEQPRVDLYCDPLPQGASARLGSMRWRHNHSSSWFTAQFAPRGKVIASWATNQRSTRLWNASDGKLLREIVAGEDGIWSPVFSADGQWLAGLADGNNRAPADAMNRTLVLMEVAAGTTRRLRVAPEEGADINLRFVSFSPDAKILAVSTSNGDLHLFDFPSGRQRRKLPRAVASASSFSFKADSKTLMALSLEQRKIYYLDTQTGAVTRVVDLVGLETPRVGFCTYWRFSPDGTTLAFHPETGNHLFVYDTATGKERFHVQSTSGPQRRFCYFADSKTLLTNRPDEGENISLWDTQTGQRKRRLKIPTEWNDEFDISPDGKTLLATDGTPTLRLWDLDTGKRLTPRQGHEDLITHLVATPDSKTLISSSRDGRILVWDLTSSRITRELPQVVDGLGGLTVRPMTDEVVTWTREGAIRFRNWRTGQESRRIDINQLFDKKEPSNQGSKRFLYGLECSPDGSQALIFVGQIPGGQSPYS